MAGIENIIYILRMRIFSPKFWPFFVSVLFMAIMVLFSATPIVWQWSGSESETYPELFFLFFGVPLASWLVAASVFIAMKGYRILSLSLPLWRPFVCGGIIGLASIGLLCLWLALNVEMFGSLAFFANWIAFVVLLAGGLWAMWEERKQEPPPPRS